MAGVAQPIEDRVVQPRPEDPAGSCTPSRLAGLDELLARREVGAEPGADPRAEPRPLRSIGRVGAETASDAGEHSRGNTALLAIRVRERLDEERLVQTGRCSVARGGDVGADQRRARVVVAGHLLAREQVRQLREDQRLGLPAEDVPDPGVVILRCRRTPVPAQRGRGEVATRFGSRARALERHRTDQVGRRQQRQPRVASQDLEGGFESSRAILRQGLGELEVRQGPGRALRRRDRALDQSSGSGQRRFGRQQEAGTSDALAIAGVAGVLEPREQLLASTAMIVLSSEVQAQLGITIPGQRDGGIGLDRSAKESQGFLCASHAHEERAQADLRGRVRRIELEDSAILGFGLLELVQARQASAQVVAVPWSRLEVHRRAEGLEGLPSASQPQQAIADVLVRHS